MGYKTDKTSLRVDTRNKCSSIKKTSTINLSWSVLYWVDTSYDDSKGVWMSLSWEVVGKPPACRQVFLWGAESQHTFPRTGMSPKVAAAGNLQPCEPMRTIVAVLLLLLACPRGSRGKDTTSTSLSGSGVRNHPTLLPTATLLHNFYETSGVTGMRGRIRHFPAPGNYPWCSV